MTETPQPPARRLPDRLPELETEAVSPTRPAVLPPGPDDDADVPFAPPSDVAKGMRIGLWGASASGKTTFVNALAHVANNTTDYGRWRVMGMDDGERTFLTEGKQRLINEGGFPEATISGSELRFGFAGQRLDGTETHFVLHVQDRPGGDFHDRSADMEQVATQLAQCHGFVLLFDPLRERRDSNSADYLFGMLEHITTLLAKSGETKLYLPFEVAVCVTKWDDPGVFMPARAAGWGTQDRPDGAPRVKDHDAKAYFTWACRYFGADVGQRVDRIIEKYFDPARTCYFVSSSVGFRRYDGERFDARKFANVQGNRISQINPINVIEPFLELERRLRRRR